MIPKRGRAIASTKFARRVLTNSSQSAVYNAFYSIFTDILFPVLFLLLFTIYTGECR